MHLLQIEKINVSIDGHPILKDIVLEVEPGRVHAIMGPNGSGKSTLGFVLAGHPSYTITSGRCVFNGQDITHAQPDVRARTGLFLAFQHPESIPGVTVREFLKEAYAAVVGAPLEQFQKELVAACQLLDIEESFIHRSLNDGFSGGQKKRIEILQLMLLRPRLAILDEIDSGLDVDALKLVAAGVAQARRENPSLAIIIITHYQRILSHISPDFVHVLCNGTIVTSGAAQLAQELDARGYDAYR